MISNSIAELSQLHLDGQLLIKTGWTINVSEKSCSKCNGQLRVRDITPQRIMLSCVDCQFWEEVKK